MRALLLLVVVCLGFSNLPDRWVGRYTTMHRKLERDRLELSEDSTFWFRTKGCTHNYEVKGRWRVEADTLRLQFLRIKGMRGGWEAYDENSIVDDYSKGVARGDSLDLRWTHLGYYHPGLALVRLTEPVPKNWRR